MSATGAEAFLRVEDRAARDHKGAANGRAGGDTPPPQKPALPELASFNIADFLRLDIPPRRMLLEPILPEKGLAMIYAMRGVGKTLLAMSCAYAVATGGGFLGWAAPEPRRVLFIDGEMPAVTMQERLAAIVKGFLREPPDPTYFRILSADLSEAGLPDLSSEDGQATFDAAIGDADLIVVDNISCLCRSGKENEAESWQTMQDWALRHRRAGRSILFVHHAGKGGAQRGTSKREDVLDTVIALRRPEDYSPESGAKFQVHLEKARGVHGGSARPFEAGYEVRDGAALWNRVEIEDADYGRVVELLREGLSIRDIAEATGLHRSRVHRLRKRAIGEGEFKPRKGSGGDAHTDD